MGRESNRDKFIKVYFTEDEKDEVEDRADEKGQQLSSYGRMKILGEA